MTTTIQPILVNDRPLEDFGLIVTQPMKGWTDAIGLTWSPVAIPGEILAIDPLSLTPEARGLEFRTLITPSTVAGRRLALAALYRHCGRGLVQLRFGDGPDRYVDAKFLGAVGDGGQFREMVSPEIYATLRFVAADPHFYWSQPDTRHVVAGIPCPIPLGSAGARVTLYLSGVSPSTTLTVTSMRTGATLAMMTFTGSLTSGQWLRINVTGRRLAVESGSPPTSADAYQWKGATDPWPVIDLADRPAVTISNGDGFLLSRAKETV